MHCTVEYDGAHDVSHDTSLESIVSVVMIGGSILDFSCDRFHAKHAWITRIDPGFTLSISCSWHYGQW